MPLQVSVSQIAVGQGNLWIALHFEPGVFVKTTDASAASDESASDVGKVRKIVTIGHYDLNVTINRVVGRLRTGTPVLKFGGNRVSLALPVTVVSGSGEATIYFKWDGRNISGAVCGDMDLTHRWR